MTNFELNYKKIERLPQRHQLSTIFKYTIGEVLETIETEDVDTSTSRSIIEPILNHNFDNTFQHQNGPNQRQHIHKNTIQHY